MREAAKKTIFLMAVPLRAVKWGGEWVKGLTIKKKITYFKFF